ncbi:nuclear transport factor 2 family protein [Actinophytocola sp.]|uniref:nuclear transport factor 2 family protein n=1 Tax=Actinophytocola sp. TaxID=1872138 RepID=UPI003D6AE697
MSEQEVLDLVKRWATAELNEDADALGGLLADDFTGIGPLGFVLTKQRWTGRYRGGELKNSEFEVVDAQVRAYGDTAVVVGVQKQETTFAGNDTGGQFRLTLVAVRRDAGWVIANLQLSGPLGPPPSMPPNFKQQG